MAFIILSTVNSAAVATSGTFTITAPNQAIVGAIKNGGGHVLSVRGMQALFSFPNDWTITWSTVTGTITYNGSTTIPAGSAISVQLELAGDNANFPYHQKNANQIDSDALSGAGGGLYRGAFGQVFRVDFGAPLVASTTAVVSTGTARVSGTLNTYTTPYVLDVPRALQATSSSGSDTTTVLTIRGLDEYGVAITESFALNGTAVISGKKAFKVVISDTASVATMVGTVSIGFLNILGLPYYLPAQTGTGIGSILRECQDGAAATAGTAVGGVLTKASATTGDVRGTILPNTTPDGVKVYSVFMFVADTEFKGVPQFGT